MKKRIMSLFAAFALAAAMVMPVCAEESVDIAGTARSAIMLAEANTTSIKVSGPAGVTANVLSGSGLDTLRDNAVTEGVRELVKNDVSAGEADPGSEVVSVYYCDLTASEPGQVTFRFDNAASGDYAVVLHYTGQPGDTNGITAQFCKMTSGGVTANFNSYSPVAIVVTKVGSAQRLANAFPFSEGSDAPSMSATIVSDTNPAYLAGLGAIILVAVAGGVYYKKRNK